MKLPEKQEQIVRDTAETSVAAFKQIADDAAKGLGEETPKGAETFAYTNTLNTDKAAKRLSDINVELAVNLRHLQQEPAIARVVVIDEEDEAAVPVTYYITRCTPYKSLGGNENLAGYRGPLGRMAALDVGDSVEIKLPKSTHYFEVVEKALLRPQEIEGIWDSRDSQIYFSDDQPLTIRSLRSFLESFEVESVDSLDDLLAEEDAEENVRRGIGRTILTKMALRDQPVLDRYQDEVFRLPISTRLILLGPPGSGKTTTLIKRIGQKLDVDAGGLSDEFLSTALGGGPGDTSRAWTMFTPTELLKQYLKEAFNKENIPASDDYVRTWDRERLSLARSTFDVLATANRNGLRFSKEMSILSTDAEDNLSGFCDAFNSWQNELFWKSLKESLETLSEWPDEEIAAQGRAILNELPSSVSNQLGQAFTALFSHSGELRPLFTRLQGETSDIIEKSLNACVNRDREFLDKLVIFLDEMGEVDDDDEGDEEEADLTDDDLQQQSLGPRRRAKRSYERALSALARAEFQKRKLREGSQAHRITDWLGDRLISADELVALGQKLMARRHIQKVLNALPQYYRGMAARYRRFRREQHRKGEWYLPGDFNRMAITPQELDAILFCCLDSTQNILQRRDVWRRLDENYFMPVRRASEALSSQIFVDEATDFSPIQLGCMRRLCSPATQSFFACGDYNQRLTSWGIKDQEGLEWAAGDIATKEIRFSYRQSKELNDFAMAIADLSGRNTQAVLPNEVDTPGKQPALGYAQQDFATTADWLAARISEVERTTGEMPSIAVFLNEEGKLSEMEVALNRALSSLNVRAKACHGGDTVGSEDEVRIFDIQHIKGLEFEAAFLIGIDELATARPDLFFNYLYVGATRAATFLGMTCNGDSLPPEISTLQEHFCDEWN